MIYDTSNKLGVPRSIAPIITRCFMVHAMCLYTPSVRNSFSGLWNRLQVDRTVEISRSIFSERAPYHLLLLPRPPMRLSARRIGEGEGAPWNERESSLFVKAKETALLHVSIKSQKPFPSPHLLSRFFSLLMNVPSLPTVFVPTFCYWDFDDHCREHCNDRFCPLPFSFDLSWYHSKN